MGVCSNICHGLLTKDSFFFFTFDLGWWQKTNEMEFLCLQKKKNAKKIVTKKLNE